MTWVIKIGGSVRNPDALLHDVAAAHERIVMVHGASRRLNELSTRLGNPPRMVESGRGDVTRYTDSTAMDHFLMAYAGLANKRIVERLRQLGVNALGLSGLDGGVVSGQRRADLRVVENGRTRILHDNHVGSIDDVDASLLQLLLERGYTPVLTPPIAAGDGTAINVDGDRLAAEIAIALHAERFFIFTDTPGILRDAADFSSVVAHIDPADIGGAFAGRVRPKLQAAARAHVNGVERVVIAGAGTAHPLQRAVDGAGTIVRRRLVAAPG